MSLADYNPFQQAELRIPEGQANDTETIQQAFGRLSRTFTGTGVKPDPEDRPFDRYVDLWMLAVCLGAREVARGHPIVRLGGKGHRFAHGAIFQGDTARIELLEMLAIALANDPRAIENKKGVIDLANDLAATGIPVLFEMLEGHGKALWNVIHNLTEAVTAAKADSAVGSPNT